MPDNEPNRIRGIGQAPKQCARTTKLESITPRQTASHNDADKELDQAWGEWETTFDAIQDSIMLLDCEFNVVQANAATSRILGRPLDEIVGKKCYELVHETDAIFEGCPLKKALSTKKRQEVAMYLASKDIWAAVSVDPILDEQGNMTGAVHILRDITDRKRAEEALRESEEHFRNIFENAVLGLYRTTPDRRIVMANPALIRMLGYASLKQLARRNLEDEGFEPAYSRSIFKEHIEADGQTTGLESAWTRRDGTTLFVRESAKAVLDAEGNTLYYEGTVEDITERKKAEDQSLRQAQVLEAINKVLREALACDTDIEVAQTCLNMAEELTGSKFGFIGESNETGLFDTIAISNPGWETCKMPHSEATRSISNMRIRGIWGSVLREGRSRIVNDPASHPDKVGVPEGHPPITCFLGVPLKQMGKTIGMIGLGNKQSGYDEADQEAIETLSVVFVEALMRKRAAQELLDYQEQLKTLTSELALAEERERRRIAAGIHDNIGQKLAMAKLELQLLMRPPGNSKIPASLDSVCDKIDSVIEDTHSLTFELSNPALYELSFDVAIEQWLFEQIQKKHGIKCRVVAYPEPVKLGVDLKVVLFRAIRELAVNVVKYAKASTLRVNIKKGKDRIMISVRDDGAGFVPSEAGAFVLDEKGGFGLFNIRERLEHLGGAMKIQSAPGKGTRITLTAPLEQQ